MVSNTARKVKTLLTYLHRAFDEDLSDMIAQESRKRQKRDEERRSDRKDRSQR
jgi:hypothetical protein